MSRLTDLIAQTKARDPDLGFELEREFKALSARRTFGLNFERHRPEHVALPGRPARKGDKVRALPPRGSSSKGDQRLWSVLSLEDTANGPVAYVELAASNEQITAHLPIEDLIVVAEFKDYIYPGLESTGKVQSNATRPYHTVINGENFHALEALTFTHRGKIDAVYIDPPYNTGAKDWKYNNDYVDKEDLYRHSKWLAFMERRLILLKELMNPNNSVLIVTIDEKEYLRLGLLLEQTFPGQRIQMISSAINPSGVARGKEFYRVDEYIFFVYFGKSVVIDARIPGLCIAEQDSSTEDDTDVDADDDTSEQNSDTVGSSAPSVRWESLLRSGSGAQREQSKLKFYPILVDTKAGKIVKADAPLPLGLHPADYTVPAGLSAVWPIRQDGTEGRWQLRLDSFNDLLAEGQIKIGTINKKTDKITILYLPTGLRAKLASGAVKVVGSDQYGGLELEYSSTNVISGRPKTQWTTKAHSATDHGTSLLRKLIPRRKFPYPKSLYAVEDALRFFIANNPNAIVLDFFSGSGTTAHAVMRLNRQDGGARQSISITNNEVAAEEHSKLRKQGLRPGDPDWEQWGICELITKPRIRAAITGQTPEGEPVKGDYKFTDLFPLAEGFQENAEFFTLTYETPIAVSHNLAFARIAPLLWMRAGSIGRRIDNIPSAGWELADAYALLTNLDHAVTFCAAIEQERAISVAFVVTDDDRRFQSVARRLPAKVEPIRLYESYLSNFRFSIGR